MNYANTDSSPASRSYLYPTDRTVRSPDQRESEMSEVAYDPTVVPEPSAELRELGERMVGRSRLRGESRARPASSGWKAATS